MSLSWWVWPVGVVLLCAAGVGSVLVPRLRAASLERRVAWSAARAAIDRAAVSRDAAPVTVEEAERLLAEAELVVAGGGGPAAARTATDHARRADSMWRAATDA
ncbi:hypothetical protein JIG36_35155 [Actinoplanes sp. LDG1-06]|uniref:Uncharacterized protein n=1 Tax=Paractinoplanes ovalisporus TaxID=2810368 RepID=A0ABS2ALP8_9ACTN|nr:DUF6403 family protein [Actinoplanes ovalisporus]MBM2620752.1 hypothetical protein [Actinoplanes ovalisporus]